MLHCVNLRGVAFASCYAGACDKAANPGVGASSTEYEDDCVVVYIADFEGRDLIFKFEGDTVASGWEMKWFAVANTECA